MASAATTPDGRPVDHNKYTVVPKRFARAFYKLPRNRELYDAALGLAWEFAGSIGLDEAAADGWAATGLLYREIEWGPANRNIAIAQRDRDDRAALIGSWINWFGPTAYLFVLAGFTLAEAGAANNGPSGPVTDQQLKVMAALNTPTIPVDQRVVPERFVDVFDDKHQHHEVGDVTVTAEKAWEYAGAIGLDEAAAIGWAATGLLHPQIKWGPANRNIALVNRDRNDRAALIGSWINWFGPTAYLYVLAGIDLDDATAQSTDGTSPTDQQLQVMAAFNGYTLPAGV